MGATDPAFYWYPSDAGTLETTDLGEGMSDIQETPLVAAEDAYTGSYGLTRNFIASCYRVRLVLERFGAPGTSSVERALRTLESHLHRGGSVGFTRDQSKAWAGSVGTGRYALRGSTLLYTSGSLFTAWSPSGTLANGDEVVVESANPIANREFKTASSITAGQLTLAAGLTYDHTTQTFARWRDFYPTLKLPKDQLGRPIVTHDHRITFTFDATFEYDFSALASYLESAGSNSALPLASGADKAGGSVLGNGGSSSSRWTLDGLLAQNSTAGTPRSGRIGGGWGA
jgi:hypothetical protein